MLKAAIAAILLAFPAAARAAAPIGSPVNLTQIGGVAPSTAGVTDAPGTIRVYNVAPSGTVTFPAGALAVTSTGTVISTGSITAFQGGSPWNVNCANCSGGGGGGGNPASTFTVVNTTFQVVGLGGAAVVVSAAQSGSYTVTPGSGAWNTSGSTVAVTNVNGQNLNVTVSNFPAIQPVSIASASVSGSTVTVGNFPASYPVTGTFWQATQPVSIASASVSGSTVTAYVANFPASQAVTGAFYQATQPVSVASASVSGSTVTAYVANFPTSQAVTGAFFQATQPVSQANSVTVTPGSGTFQVSGAFYQTTQPVSLASASVSGSTVTVYQGGSWTITASTIVAQGVYYSTPQVIASSGSSSLLIDVQGNQYTRDVGAPLARNVPVQTSTAASTFSIQLLAGNANRVALECNTGCSNTDVLYTNWGTVSASTNSAPTPPCSSWQPPAVSTVAIQFIANTSTQTINCTEYNNQ